VEEGAALVLDCESLGKYQSGGKTRDEAGASTMCFASVFVLIQSEAGAGMRKIGR
jgi:hypothetical protein